MIRFRPSRSQQDQLRPDISCSYTQMINKFLHHQMGIDAAKTITVDARPTWQLVAVGILHRRPWQVPGRERQLLRIERDRRAELLIPRYARQLLLFYRINHLEQRRHAGRQLLTSNHVRHIDHADT